MKPGRIWNWARYLIALVWTPLAVIAIPASLANGHWLFALWCIFCWPFNAHLAVDNTRRLWRAEPIR